MVKEAKPKDHRSECVAIKNIVLVFLACGFINTCYAKGLNENFDGGVYKFTEDIVRSHKGVIDPHAGINNSKALKIYYKGNERGSERVVASEQLDKSYTTATLEFSVKFCPAFDFVKGGKLHGLGPMHPISGGKEITPEGWSARLMFKKDGGLMTYIYYQDMNQKFGKTKTAQDFKFIPDRYYKIKMTVHVNSESNKDDGWVNVYVDGNQVIHHEGLRFRETINSGTAINKFLFSTFHGGSTKEWAPVNLAGEYITECAYFDDISVY